MTALTLRFTDVKAGYDRDRPILNGISLTAAAGCITALIGPNGAGKSTLLKVAAGLLKPSSGAVMLGDRNISNLPAHEHLSHGIGTLAQGPTNFPELSVEQNVELGGWLLRHDRSRLRNAVEATFERYQILQEARHKTVGNLSGGLQRLVSIARLMVAQPRILLIDEPSVGLSPMAAAQIYRELETLKAEGSTILLVDQNIRAAVSIADHVYVLNGGRSESDGDAESFRADLSAPVRAWLTSEPL